MMLQNRIQQINILRGIACLMVIIDHMFFSTKYFNIGAFGVGLFFLVSGFVIPISLKSAKSPITFMVRRCFRLYPVIIFILGFIVLYSAFVKPIYIRYPGFDLPEITFLNFVLTVMQIWDITQSPLYAPIFWTLVIEEKFYFLMAIIFKFNKNLEAKKLFNFAIFILSFFLIVSVFSNNFYKTLILRNIMFISFMLYGTLFYFLYTKAIESKASHLYFGLFSLLIILTFILNTKQVTMIEQISWQIHRSQLIKSYGLAFFVFWLFKNDMALFSKMPKPIIKSIEFIALISFPLYAIHTEIWANIANRSNPFLWFLLLCILSFIIHKIIEKPFIKLGKRF